ncbi:MAG: hypothetical protein ACPG4U_03255 [Pseudomonadales bacterium]
MSKSLITNTLAALVVLIAYISGSELLFSIGAFALSGALTNWLAVHMLFEKVPGLYGSGVIPARFEQFKAGIQALIMEQFFTEQNIDRFLQNNAQAMELNLQPVIEKVDLEPTFDGLIGVIESSSFGSLLAMAGGAQALEPMREPFIAEIRRSVTELSQSERFKALLIDALEQPNNVASIIAKVESIVEQRLAELTPALVKDIVQQMIRQHLGWLVVWGGVFGGLIGALVALFT